MNSAILTRSSHAPLVSRSLKPAAFAAVQLIIVTIVINLTACSQKIAGGQDAVANTLLSLTDRYNAAWETLDLDNISKFHSDDIRYYWRGTLASASQSEFERLLREDILTEITAYSAEMIEPHVKVLGPDAGIVSFGFRGQVVTPDGKTHDYSGAMSYVLERRNGDWKIVLIHESAPVPDP